MKVTKSFLKRLILETLEEQTEDVITDFAVLNNIHDTHKLQKYLEDVRDALEYASVKAEHKNHRYIAENTKPYIQNALEKLSKIDNYNFSIEDMNKFKIDIIVPQLNKIKDIELRDSYDTSKKFQL